VNTQVLEARTLSEVEAAEAALTAWLERHPADTGMEDGFEQLANLREAAETRQAVALPATAAAEDPCRR
jgi:hypothetical protein